MGKGTLISDGQGDDKKIWVTEAVTYEGRVMAAAGTTTYPFNATGTNPVVKGAMYDLSWDARNSCVTFNTNTKLTPAKGSTNNQQGKSTEFTVGRTAGDAGDTGWTLGKAYAIQTDANAGGTANSNYPGKNVTATPVSGGAGWLEA